MMPQRWPRMLLWLALSAHAVAGAHTAAPPRHLQAAANSSDSPVVCPTGDSPLASTTAPALTSLCPESCEVGGVCVYYPQGFESACVTAYGRTCVAGASCAFECFTGTGTESPGWFLTLYDAPSVVEDVARANTKNAVEYAYYRSIAINASLVRQWVGTHKFSSPDYVLYIVGNEPANNMELDEVRMYNDDVSLPPGAVAPVEFPPSFFDDLRGFGWLRFENLKFPAVTNVSPALALPGLSKLFLRNTMLTSFPLANASLPDLQDLDLSANSISEIVPAMIPNTVTFLNLSWNAITHVEKGALPKNLTTLDMRINPLKELTKGTLPPTLQQLRLMQSLLSEIPADVARMTNLKMLFLDDNDLREIPTASIPPSHLEQLSLENCSLTTVPKVLESMTGLKELWLGRNDFSHTPNFSILPKSLEYLSLRGSQLQNLPVELKNLRSLNELDLENNPQAVTDLSTLPKQIQTLFLENNALEKIPGDLKRINVVMLSLLNNPLGQIAPGSLPRSLGAVQFSNTTFREVSKGTLPEKLTQLHMISGALEVVPVDLPTLRELTILEISGCRLSSLDMGDQLPLAEWMAFSDNRISSFSGNYPALLQLELRNNALTTFENVKAAVVQWVDLSGNGITAFPQLIFELPALRLLNLTGNPIRNFRPTSEQLEFLGRIQVVVLDQAMFSSDFVLALLVYAFWRRRKLQKQRQEDLAAEQAKLAKQQQEQTTVSVWADAALLRDRIDEDLVDRKRLLGSGMFGDVWLATYKGEKVALKQLKQSGSASGGTLDREAIRDFVHEIKLLQSLSHPSVVSFVGVVWTKESDLGMVTEYMAGGDLRSYLDHHPKIYAGWTTQMVRIALQITEAIVYLHSLDPVVIHRDLKSRNVLLDTAMRAKLSDFGVSRYKVDDETMTAGVGTVRWVAPEVLAGQRYDEAVDIYSLGVIFSEIDTHKLPFDGLTDETGGELLSDSAIAGMVVTGALQVGASKSCPSEIRSLVQKCTMFDATKRPSAGDVAYELRAMLEGSSAATSNSTGTGSSSNGIFRSSATSVGTSSTRTLV